MTVEDKLEQVRSVLVDHNSAVGGENAPGYVDVDNFFTLVKAIGGSSEEGLKRFSHEQIADCLPEVSVNGSKKVKQMILAKSIAAIFRQKDSTSVDESPEKRPVSSKKVERMTLQELVSAFDPSDSNNRVSKRLREISRGENFVVYVKGRDVDVVTTLQLLKEVQQGYDGRDSITVDETLKKVHSIDYLPENYADENPLYPDRPLRPDGTCDQTNRSWEGVALKLRQIVRIALDRGDIKVSRETSHDILDLIMGKDPLEALSTRYSEAVLAYDELSEHGKLPQLRITLVPVKTGVKMPGPFRKGNKVTWGHGPGNSYIGR